MNLRILQEAEREINEAIGYYEAIEPGLGIRLKEEVCQALLWIQENATVPRLRSQGYRRVNLKVFPYYIAFLTWADTVWILAIAHSRRRPEYWLQRKQQTG